MASYTAGRVGEGGSVLVGVNGSYAPRQHLAAVFSGALPPDGVAVPEPEPDEREPGDYLATFALGSVTEREVLYTAGANVTGVIREIIAANSATTNATLKLWVGGTLAESGLVIPAGESRSQTVGGWIVRGGETFEAEGNPAVNLLAFGVEEVREVSP